MTKATRPERDLRTAIEKILASADVAEIPLQRRVTLAAEAVWTWAGKQAADQPNKGQPWSDASLRVVLQQAPTHENIYRMAQAFGRNAGSVEQIYRWAATPDKVVKEKRPVHAFIQQIKRIAKEVGWEAF